MKTALESGGEQQIIFTLLEKKVGGNCPPLSGAIVKVIYFQECGTSLVGTMKGSQTEMFSNAKKPFFYMVTKYFFLVGKVFFYWDNNCFRVVKKLL